jgi:hypothetical protein
VDFFDLPDQPVDRDLLCVAFGTTLDAPWGPEGGAGASWFVVVVVVVVVGFDISGHALAPWVRDMCDHE